jgi:hypothetical protein
VEVVTSVGVTIAGSSVMKVEVAAVRARERVHRLPFTVVIDSCGEAMQATAYTEKRPTRAQERRRREGTPSAAGALGILTWEIEVFRYLMLDNGLTKREVSRRWRSGRIVVNRWHKVVRLYGSETRAASCAASSSDYNTHEAR